MNDLTILLVESPDLNQVARVSTITCDELRHNCHGFQRIDGEFRTTTIEFLVARVAHAERIYVATILVTNTLVTLSFVIVTTISPLTSELCRPGGA